MRYFGGKNNAMGDAIAKILYHAGQGRSTYVEPFVGSAAIVSRVARYFDHAIAGDVVPDVIMLWQAVQSGWLPPRTITAADHARLKHEEPSALRAFVGFGCSYGGMWFHKWNPDLVAGGRRSLQRKAHGIRNVDFRLSTYDKLIDNPSDDMIIYCDPPYKGSYLYEASGVFDHEPFYRTAEAWSDAGALVFMSEYSAPEHWSIITAPNQRVGFKGHKGSRVDYVFAPPSTAEVWKRR